MTDVLTIRDLRRTDSGHAYLLSRWPDKVELAEVVGALDQHADAISDVVRLGYDFSGSGEVIEVFGLTTGARVRVEKAILDALTQAAAVMGADTATGEAAIRASLDALPLNLP